jgi:hypothetical protein
VISFYFFSNNFLLDDDGEEKENVNICMIMESVKKPLLSPETFMSLDEEEGEEAVEEASTTP